MVYERSRAGRTGARREEEVTVTGWELNSRFCVAVGG